MKRLSLYVAALSACGVGLPGVVNAQAGPTANFNVTLTITANCVIAANNLAFGTHGVLNTAITGNTTLNVTCSNTTPYTVGLSSGTGTGSSGTTRFMQGTGSNTATVAYQLYQPNSPTVVWGDAQVADRVGGVGNGSAQALVVNGTVPVQTTPAPDTYSSTVTATVYF
ncbi:spore coat U domain-containing protein [Achromobacter sp. B7]|uniref:Csu type fimbrial protein n=1 Tax=Achromobacter sp. B7 TaxID=2282475 RepID=UPI000E70B534|nr:spore coat U domain-containing protein [Achromobacter sp. B7]AYD62699.1 spore coat U domain-containing protein [Achromobacter sp. B7]